MHDAWHSRLGLLYEEGWIRAAPLRHYQAYSGPIVDDSEGSAADAADIGEEDDAIPIGFRM